MPCMRAYDSVDPKRKKLRDLLRRHVVMFVYSSLVALCYVDTLLCLFTLLW